MDVNENAMVTLDQLVLLRILQKNVCSKGFVRVSRKNKLLGIVLHVLHVAPFADNLQVSFMVRRLNKETIHCS